jgi:uncharacterized protein (TIGR03492 family)
VRRVLFVSNGHGEAAIAGRIARELRGLLLDAQMDHLALVGDNRVSDLREVGPRRAMPSGGLVAMGNVPNLIRDLRAGLLGLIARQRRFLRDVRGKYDAAVAVGDTYALGMTLRARTPTVFVGTAKSVHVAAYGTYERRVLSRAAVLFVRDEPTAQRLREDGLEVEPGNVIVDLFAPQSDERIDEAMRDFAPVVALLPGSRTGAYADASFLLDVVDELLPRYPRLGAVLSIAGGLDASHFASDAARRGWALGAASDGVPFTLSRGGRSVVVAWSGELGAVFCGATLVLGQAGTANEGAAGQGVPVVAFSGERWGASRWYRRRQQGLLGEALAVVPRRLPEATEAVAALLDDSQRRRVMGEAGRQRMGAAGASRRIAAAIAKIVKERSCVA